MAFLGFWRSASLRSAIFLLNGVRRSGVNGPQLRPLKLSFGNPTSGHARGPAKQRSCPLSHPSC
jgi:hypothetical protein